MKKNKALSYTYLLHIFISIISIKYILGENVIIDSELNPRSASFLVFGLIGGAALILITSIAYMKRIELQVLLAFMVITIWLKIEWLGFMYLAVSIVYASYWFFIIRKGSIL